MRVELYTIPDTGTRFVSSLLRHLGADYSRQHTNDPLPKGRLVLTVRDPYDCYLSHRHNGRPWTDAQFVGIWASYIINSLKGADLFHFALDVDPERRYHLIYQLQMFCGLKEDTDRIKSFKWEPLYQSDRDRSLTIPDHMIEPLNFALEWYNHHTEFWGVKE